MRTLLPPPLTVDCLFVSQVVIYYYSLIIIQLRSAILILIGTFCGFKRAPPPLAYRSLLIRTRPENFISGK